MNNDAHIPLLKDLIYRGRLNQRAEQNIIPADANGDLEIDREDAQEEQRPTLSAEEIRIILHKHMDNAYAEIMQLLEQKNDD